VYHANPHKVCANDTDNANQEAKADKNDGVNPFSQRQTQLVYDRYWQDDHEDIRECVNDATGERPHAFIDAPRSLDRRENPQRFDGLTLKYRDQNERQTYGSREESDKVDPSSECPHCVAAFSESVVEEDQSHSSEARCSRVNDTIPP
jgi:hypothetical protein